jgi:hypothetical protein
VSNWPSELKFIGGLPSMTCPAEGATGSEGMIFLFVPELWNARDCKSCWPMIPVSGFWLGWVLVVSLSTLLTRDFGCLVRLWSHQQKRSAFFFSKNKNLPCG